MEWLGTKLCWLDERGKGFKFLLQKAFQDFNSSAEQGDGAIASS